jgi:hypothetical protein
VKYHIFKRVGFEVDARPVQTTAFGGEAGTGQVRQRYASDELGARRTTWPGFEPEIEHPLSHLISVTLTGSCSDDLAAVCILTRPSRLQYRKLDRMIHQYIASSEIFPRQAGNSCDRFRCAVWLARVSKHGIVEIYAACQAHVGKSRFGVPGAWVCT